MSGSATAPAVVRARDVSYIASGRLLVRAVSLDVRAGEVVAVVGPNGAGKTTLLRLFGLLLRASAGRLELFGGELPDERLHRRIGFMGHETYLYGHLTARENLMYYATLAGVRERDARADAMLRRVGLAGVADAPVRSFSRGMGQRLSLARALVGDPELLILDEPDSGLDRNARGLLGEVLAQGRERGRAVVWSGHDLSYVLGHSDRALLLDRGRPVRLGPAGESSVEAFAAAFPRDPSVRPALGLRGS